jgi:hypothetical protein
MESNKTQNVPYKYLYSYGSHHSINDWKEFSEKNCQIIESSITSGRDYIEFKENIDNNTNEIKINLKKMTIESQDLKGERVKRIPALK